MPSVCSLQSQNLLQWSESLAGPGSEHWKGEPAAGLKVTAVLAVVLGVVSAGVVSGAGGEVNSSTGGSGAPQPATCCGQLQTLRERFIHLRSKSLR